MPPLALPLALPLVLLSTVLALAPLPATAYEEIVCGALAPVTGSTCSVASGTSGEILLQGDVLTEGRVYRGGGVVVTSNGDLRCVGCECSAPEATVVRCPDAVVSPGLIDSVDHITFDHNLPRVDSGERYEQRHDWRLGLRGHAQITAPGNATPNQIRWTELRHLMAGTTSMSGTGGTAGLVRNLDTTANQGLGLPSLRRDNFPLGDAAGPQLESGCGYPAIRTSAAIASDPAYYAILGEGIDATARNELVCTSDPATPNDLVQPQTAFAKGMAFRVDDFAHFSERGTGLVWSPRSNVSLYGDTLRLTAARGVNVAIGTDWIVTGSMNMLRELSCADQWNRERWGSHFSQERLWRMATTEAASLSATSTKIGDLAAGKIADIAVFDASVRADHDAILNAQPEDVVLVMRDGKALFGETATVAAIANAGSCDAISVCGKDRSVCLAGEIGLTLAQLQVNQGGAINPLFECGPPTNEPTCTPARPASVAGSTVYDGTISALDLDGDGLGNASDLCPSVFNPIRPLDAGQQPDHDGDGLGDECDPVPLPEPAGSGGALLLLALVHAARRRERSVRPPRVRAGMD